jgi:hypothetical protein
VNGGAGTGRLGEQYRAVQPAAHENGEGRGG